MQTCEFPQMLKGLMLTPRAYVKGSFTQRQAFIEQSVFAFPTTAVTATSWERCDRKEEKSIFLSDLHYSYVQRACTLIILGPFDLLSILSIFTLSDFLVLTVYSFANLNSNSFPHTVH